MTTSVAGYFKDATPGQLAEYNRVRDIVKRLAPEAEEVISYGMPTFKLKGKPLMHFGVFKDHMSLFPTAEPIGALKEKLNQFATAKGTIRFTEDKTVPADLIEDLIRYRYDAIVKKS
jgi:uncharacterized protein YdhG (YjbR/CyaY superfamily)